MSRAVAPYGSWRSPLEASLVARSARRLALPQIDAGAVHWLEGRPEENGRQAVMRAPLGGEGAAEEASPPAANVRSRVHEYGGGDYLARAGELFHVCFDEAGIRRIRRAGEAGEVPGALPAARYADFDLAPDGRVLVAVEECPREGAEPESRIVALALDRSARRVVAEGRDFYAAPRFAPDGRRLAFLAWDHPDMPWDAAALFVQPWADEGPAGAARRVAGGAGTSAFQPAFSPVGRLTFAADPEGWWQLFQEPEPGAEPVPLARCEGELGRPHWTFAPSTFGFAEEELLLASARHAGFDRLVRIERATGRATPLPLPYARIDGLRVGEAHAAFLGGRVDAPTAVCTLDLATGRVRERRRAFDLDLEPARVAVPEAIEFPSEGGRRAHAFVYRPASPECEGPPGERPPLLVKSHGGPTGAATPALQLGVQYWTSRGFAVVDVDYAGSTGYGRAYREALYGQWGVADVDDCTRAAQHLAEEGLADRARLAITGGSAGGFTTLCALTFRDVFAAGASHYGVADLEALARQTHKFESRYLERLVGPYPARRDLYVARSPLHHAERLACPVVFFQGLEDRVVPPAQAEAMVAALAERGLPHAYVPFEGEQHGFRRAESLRKALETELWFYGRVLGFPTELRPEGVRLEGRAGAGSRRRGRGA